MNLDQELEKLGLSEKEAKTYLALLELSEETAYRIAKKSGLNRPTAYVVLEALIKKGLASKYEKKGVTYYIAEDPDGLDFLFSVQQQEIEQKRKQLQGVIGQLRTIKAMQNTERPFVKFFEGKKGLLATRNEMLSGKAKLVRMMYSLGGYKSMYNEIERNEAHGRRVKNHVKAKILYTTNDEDITDDSSREATKLDSARFPLTADIALYDTYVRIASLNERFSGIVIDDPEISKTLASIFELAWIGARALAKDSSKK